MQRPEARTGGRPPTAIHAFEAMSEPVRRRIVDILASGEHTSGQLAEVIGHEFRISRTAVSKHLGILLHAGFVEVRAELNWRFYRLKETGLQNLEGELADLRYKWERRIGWDADRHEKFDPAAGFAHSAQKKPRRKGPGRSIRRGTRGRQSEILPSSDPEDGLYPVHQI